LIDVADLLEYLRTGNGSRASAPVATLTEADAGLSGISLDEQERQLLSSALRNREETNPSYKMSKHHLK
jgi:hypothetical protein